MASLSGKIAIVTGGSKGIGKATSLALAKAGATVVINYARDSSAADALVSEIGSQAHAVQADSGTLSGINHLVESTVSKYGKIDILIANAGIMNLNTLENVSEDEFDQMFSVNVKGPLFLVQKAVPHMPQGSHVVLLSTTLTAASTVTPNYLVYNATKGAVEQMARCLSKGLAAKGIAVNVVSPGPTGTELFMKGKSEQVLKTVASFNPHNRIGQPDEVADVIVFLSGDGSRWVTGQNIRVNGGMA